MGRLNVFRGGSGRKVPRGAKVCGKCERQYHFKGEACLANKHKTFASNSGFSKTSPEAFERLPQGSGESPLGIGDAVGKMEKLRGTKSSHEELPLKDQMLVLVAPKHHIAAVKALSLDTSREDFAKLVQHPNRVVRTFALKNPHCPEEFKVAANGSAENI